MEKKEAMKILKDFHDKSALFSIRTALDTIIPELKECEDEDKIMKELIYNIIVSNDNTPSSKEIFSIYGKTKKDAIAWIEKQGEQSQYWKPSKEQLKALDFAYNLCPDTERANYYEGVLETLIDDLHKLSEKQDEQKYIDSDWVDLGLPSGTLWKNTNETNPDSDLNLYTYDEAMQKFGDQLPTKKQLEELKNNCRWTWTGNGYNVTGPNGNSIFMPTTGNISCGISSVVTRGSYWSSKTRSSQCAWYLYFTSLEIGMNTYYRWSGQSVRLVNKL